MIIHRHLHIGRETHMKGAPTTPLRSPNVPSTVATRFALLADEIVARLSTAIDCASPIHQRSAPCVAIPA